jgi:hypothetical protein
MAEKEVGIPDGGGAEAGREGAGLTDSGLASSTPGTRPGAAGAGEGAGCTPEAGAEAGAGAVAGLPSTAASTRSMGVPVKPYPYLYGNFS